MKGFCRCFSAAAVMGAVAAAFGQGPKHILFAFVDHFEPTYSPSPTTPNADVIAWVNDYMAMAGKHVDADGRHPIHTYFLLAEEGGGGNRLQRVTLPWLNKATYAGYGRSNCTSPRRPRRADAD